MMINCVHFAEPCTYFGRRGSWEPVKKRMDVGDAEQYMTQAIIMQKVRVDTKRHRAGELGILIANQYLAKALAGLS